VNAVVKGKYGRWLKIVNRRENFNRIFIDLLKIHEILWSCWLIFILIFDSINVNAMLKSPYLSKQNMQMNFML
jgi:hypothetical protein